VESSGREANDGQESRLGSKFQNPQSEACGVHSSVWVQERAGHEGQGTSSRLEHPVNFSQVSAPDVRNCQIKTTPCVEKERFITECWAAPHVQGAAAWLKRVVGFVGEAKPWGRERESLLSDYLSSTDGTGSGLCRRGQAMGEGERVSAL
jgi:hypothetical protein